MLKALQSVLKDDIISSYRGIKQMQRLSVEQVAILSILYELEFKEILIDGKTLEEETNESRFEKIKPNMDLDTKEIDDTIEELQYWKYIDENCNLTVLGRQYLKTGPDSSADNSITKNYNITLFEKIAELKGIEVNFSTKASIIDSLSSIFNWSNEKE